MKTYINQTISGYYVDYPEEIDSEYWKGHIGTTLSDFYKGKWVLLSDEQVQFHKDNPRASISEVFNLKLNNTEKTVQTAKNEKLEQISNYDNSDSVNQFIVVINGNELTSWLTVEQRANYKNSIDAAELMNYDMIDMLLEGNFISLNTSTAKVMLAQIQMYADKCYLVTEQHKISVNNLSDINAIDNYNYKLGYPEKLRFEI